MAAKLGAFVGKIAFVDLTSKSVEVADLPREWAEKYIGGQGIATKLCYDLIPAGCDPYGPENRIIMSAGTFINTMVPGASKLLLNTKGPLNNRYATSSSGIFADKLKAGGYDHIVVSGVSDSPVYILVDNGTITIKDASHIWGLDTKLATEQLWADEPASSVITIGPAGERMAPRRRGAAQPLSQSAIRVVPRTSRVQQENEGALNSGSGASRDAQPSEGPGRTRTQPHPRGARVRGTESLVD
jgi:aldehyde:ferredoxin oxidoreductase